jgi:hypothetical protein
VSGFTCGVDREHLTSYGKRDRGAQVIIKNREEVPLVNRRVQAKPASLGAFIDRVFAWIKWPIAILALLLLPSTAIALLHLAGRIVATPLPMSMFALGLAVYLALWWWLFRYSRFTFFMTLEHELTHALFAALTFHRVKGLRVTLTRGGQVTYVGEGNWLISVAPYFFPTLSLVLILVFAAIPVRMSGLDDVIVGASFAYHLTSTWRETHSGQSDIKKTGIWFCGAFLPTANMVTVGIVLAFAHARTAGVTQFLLDIWNHAKSLLT